MVCAICSQDHPETDSRALSILASTPRRLEKLLSSVGPREAGARPMPGKWSIKEIASHLADTELVYGFRYRRTIAEPGAQLGEFDQEIWAKELLYRKQPLVAHLATHDRNHLSQIERIAAVVDKRSRKKKTPKKRPSRKAK